MKHYSVTRVVAVVTLTCLLVTFAMPAAASSGSRSLGIEAGLQGFLMEWAEWAWAAWLGIGGDSGESSGIERVYDEHKANLEPDGVSATGSTESTTSLGGFTGGAP